MTTTQTVQVLSPEEQIDMASSRVRHMVKSDAIIRIEAEGVAVKAKDLKPGMKFGTLTAIEPSGYKEHGKKKKHRYPMWKFRCDCGNVKEIVVYGVLSGNVISCGNTCAAKNKKRMERKPHLKIEKGMKFGRLTAIEPVEHKIYHSNDKEARVIQWKFRCDCGTVKDIPKNEVLNGSTKSCGCIYADRPAKEYFDLTGMIFGRLTAISTKGKYGNTSMWECKCECGKITTVKASDLRDGGTLSCGCLRNENATNALQRYFENVLTHGTSLKIVCRQQSLKKNNTSGVTGVHFDSSSRGKKWKAAIVFQGKRYNLGRWATVEEAADARRKAEDRLYGDFLAWYKENYPDKKLPSDS